MTDQQSQPQPAAEPSARPADRLPALYLGHGAPPLLEDAALDGAARRLVRRPPPPEAPSSSSAPTGRPRRWPRRHDDRAPGLRLLRLPAALLRAEYAPPARRSSRRRSRRLMPSTEPVLDARVARTGPRRVGAAQGDVPRRGHPGPPDVHAGPGPRPPVRDRPPPGPAPRRGRAHRWVRVPDPRAAVHRRVLRGQAGRAAVVDRVRPVGGRGPGPRRPGHALRLPGEGAGDAIRASDRGALRAAVRDARAPRPSRTKPRRRSRASSWACRSGRSRRGSSRSAGSDRAWRAHARTTTVMPVAWPAGSKTPSTRSSSAGARQPVPARGPPLGGGQRPSRGSRAAPRRLEANRIGGRGARRRTAGTPRSPAGPARGPRPVAAPRGEAAERTPRSTPARSGSPGPRRARRMARAARPRRR